MDKQILDLLTEMNKEMKSMKSDIHEMSNEMNSMKADVHALKSEIHKRFDTMEAKLEGVAGQFELTNEVDFIVDKVYKLEKELYILKNKSSN